MFKPLRSALIGCALIPSLSFAACEPTFEATPSALARAWGVPPAALPAVTEAADWAHPTLADGHQLRVYNVTDLDALRNAGLRPERTNARHEYSQHSAFSASGRWLIGHGNKTRILFDGMQYKPVRGIERKHRMLDWHWDTQNDNIAFYIAPETHTVIRYDVQEDTHTPIITPDMVAEWTGVGGSLVLEGNHGQGALSADGKRMVAKFATGNDALVVVFNPQNGTHIAHARFPGLASRAKMDWQALSPSGDMLLVQGHFDTLYGTSFAKGRRNQQVRAFKVDDFAADNGQLVIGRPSHFDVYRDPDGHEFFVIAGSQPPGGWKGIRTSVRGLVQGLYTVQLDNLDWQMRLNFRQLFKNGVPAAHVSASPDDTRVLVSFYQGGNDNASKDAQDSPLLLADLSSTEATPVAWMGWDLAANPGVGNSSKGYLAQPHASMSTDMWLADGQRGMKIVWASDNNHAEKIIGNMVVGEVRCKLAD